MYTLSRTQERTLQTTTIDCSDRLMRDWTRKRKSQKGAVMNLPLKLSDVRKQVERALAIVLFIAMIALYVYIWSLHHWVM
jgi:small-conductance mechanosensitive channel